MNANDMLDMIGDARGSYIWDAQSVRSGEPAVIRKKPSVKRTLLIAAIIALMLLLVGCVAYASGWFVDFFANRSETPLSDSQIALIEENEQKIGESQTQNGWTVELRSAMTDGNKGYLIFGITAPENINLTPRIQDGRYLDSFSPCNAAHTLRVMQNPTNLVIHPKGVQPGSISFAWREDGDGLDHTKNYIVEIVPDLSKSTEDPFGPDAKWMVTIQGIVRCYDDEEYRQELLNTKYKGAYGVVFTDEETKRIQQEEILTEEIWKFTVSFADKVQSTDRLELLSAPMKTTANFLGRYSEQTLDVARFQEEITLTSILVQPFSVTISFQETNMYLNPQFYFMDEAHQVENTVFTWAVMKDGSRIRLVSNGGGAHYTLLEVESPIVVSELDYILFPDRDKVYSDGTIEYGPQKELSVSVQADYIVSQSGIYAYCADFNGDGTEDIALWYDGAFHILRLLTQTGEIKQEFRFETGMDLYETYHQRMSENIWDPYQIRTFEVVEGGEVTRYFRAEEDGLHLNVGIWKKGAQCFLSSADPEKTYDPATEDWRPITEEEYRRIAEDYQVMIYRLIPLA